MQTERLRLRAFSRADADAFLKIFSDQRVLAYWASEPISTQVEAEALVDKELQLAEDNSCHNWAISLISDDNLIGKITLFRIDDANRRAEIGYFLDSDHWGQGYMFEALGCVLDHAFDELGLHRIEADVDPGNEPSLRLLDRFGFEREGFFRERWLMRGEWYDSIMLGLLADDHRRS